jgi:hypothetical protein
MCTDLASAKHVAERWRAQGSVFTIREQPALILSSSAGAFIVTEINTEQPLGNLARRRGAESVVVEIQDRLAHKELASTVEQIASLLKASARYSWSPLCPPKSLILVGTDSVDVEFARLRSRNLKSWRSSSDGPQYFLGWIEGASNIRPAPILRISRWRNDEAKQAVEGSSTPNLG